MREQEEAGREVQINQDFFDSRALRIIMPFVVLAVGGFCGMVAIHIGSIDVGLQKVTQDEKVLEATVASHERIFKEVDEINRGMLEILKQLPIIPLLQKQIDDNKIDVDNHFKVDIDHYQKLNDKLDGLSETIRAAQRAH